MMSRVGRDQLLVPSLLDRLIDDDPESQTESVRSRSQLVSELRRSVQRDLTNLLNTKVRPTLIPASLPELTNRRSLVSYGIPDLAGFLPSTQESRLRLTEEIENAIRRFEPRLLNVQVQLSDTDDRGDGCLRLRIQAVLKCAPSNEPITYQTTIEPTTSSIFVETSSGTGPS